MCWQVHTLKEYVKVMLGESEAKAAALPIPLLLKAKQRANHSSSAAGVQRRQWSITVRWTLACFLPVTTKYYYLDTTKRFQALDQFFMGLVQSAHQTTKGKIKRLMQMVVCGWLYPGWYMLLWAQPTKCNLDRPWFRKKSEISFDRPVAMVVGKARIHIAAEGMRTF